MQLPEIERCSADLIKLFNDILIEEFAKEQLKAKEAFREQLM